MPVTTKYREHSEKVVIRKTLLVSSSLNCLQITVSSPSLIEIVSILTDLFMSAGWLVPKEGYLAGSGEDKPLARATGADFSGAL